MEENKYSMPVTAQEEHKIIEGSISAFEEPVPVSNELQLKVAVNETAFSPGISLAKECPELAAKPKKTTTTIQVSLITKAFLDTFPGGNYDEKIEHLKENWRAEEKRLIDNTVAPIIQKIDLLK